MKSLLKESLIFHIVVLIFEMNGEFILSLSLKVLFLLESSLPFFLFFHFSLLGSSIFGLSVNHSHVENVGGDSVVVLHQVLDLGSSLFVKANVNIWGGHVTTNSPLGSFDALHSFDIVILVVNTGPS